MQRQDTIPLRDPIGLGPHSRRAFRPTSISKLLRAPTHPVPNGNTEALSRTTPPGVQNFRAKALLQVSVFGAGGSVSVNPNNPGGLYEYDSNVSITAVADPHFEFVRWNGPGVSHPTNQTSTVIMSEDRNVTATFKVREYNVSITTIGQGTYSGHGVYPYDTNASLTATPATGYEFGYWLNYNSLGNPPSGLTTT